MTISYWILYSVVCLSSSSSLHIYIVRAREKKKKREVSKQKKQGKLHYTNLDQIHFDCINNERTFLYIVIYIYIYRMMVNKKYKELRSKIYKRKYRAKRSVLCITTWLPMITLSWIIIFHPVVHWCHCSFHF